MFILGIVPARGGSKAIPRKNLVELDGKPLIQYTAEALKKTSVSYFVVSTDDNEIAEVSGITPVYRPPRLAEDDTPMLPVIQHAVSFFEEMTKQKVDAVMVLQPTSPLRSSQDINDALVKFIKGASLEGRDSLVSVTEGVHPIKSYKALGATLEPFLTQAEPYDKWKHKCLTRNGAIFMCTRELLDSGRLIGDDPIPFVMPKSRSIDIDDYDDLFIAESILKHRRELH